MLLMQLALMKVTNIRCPQVTHPCQFKACKSNSSSKCSCACLLQTFWIFLPHIQRDQTVLMLSEIVDKGEMFHCLTEEGSKCFCSKESHIHSKCSPVPISVLTLVLKLGQILLGLWVKSFLQTLLAFLRGSIGHLQ